MLGGASSSLLKDWLSLVLGVRWDPEFGSWWFVISIGGTIWHCLSQLGGGAMGRRPFDTQKEGARASFCLCVYASSLLRVEGKHWVSTIANLCANYLLCYG